MALRLSSPPSPGARPKPFPPPQRRGASSPLDDLSDLPRLRAIESAKLLEHQMFFWGWDVRHPEGNLLIKAGCRSFHRAECPHAVHCYEFKTTAAEVTLHSTGVSLQMPNESTGVAYFRPTHRLYHTANGVSPLPYDKGILHSLRPFRPSEFSPALTALLAFVRAYERWAAQRWHPESRLTAWREQRTSASKGIRWLKPQDSLRWLDACLAARKAADPDGHTPPGAFEFPTHS